MFLQQRFVPGLAIYTHLVGDERVRECAVIDPTRDVDAFLEIAAENGLRITHVMETHVHADFVSGARELKDRLGDAVTVHCSGMGGEEWTPRYADHVVRDGDEVAMGTLRLRAVHTPGHTPEHVTWALFDDERSAETPWILFTGDFVFVGDVGRPDLLGEEFRQRMAEDLYESVFTRLKPFPDYAEVFPAHGAGSLCGKALGSRGTSTLGFERAYGGAFRPRAREDWISSLLEGMPVAPPYFRRMKRINRDGPPVLGSTLRGERPLSPAEISALQEKGATILDIRSKEAYPGGHIPGSVHIPLAPPLSSWAGWMLPYDRPVVLVADEDSGAARREAVTQLLRVGLDDVAGYLEGGIREWETDGRPVAHLATMSVHELARKLAGEEGGERPQVFDVRTDAEWDDGHIEGASHVHAGLIQDRFGELPQDRPVAVICGSGYRSSIVSSILQSKGHPDVTNVLGGMTAWTHAGFPTTADS